MLSYILQVTVCLTVFYALYATILSKETFFGINRWFLLGTLSLSFLIPLTPLFLSPPVEPSMVSYSLEPVVIGIRDVSLALTPAVSTPWWLTALLAIYWTGFGFLLIRFSASLRSIQKMHRHSTREISEHGRHLRTSTSVHVPFSFFKWIFLPAEHNLSETELREIIKHESAHVAAWHSIDVLLMELACIVLWPSPLIYFYRKSLRRVHEYLADAVVLRNTSLKQYGHLLLSRSAPGMQLALANHFFHNQLKHRIMMMTKHKSQRSALLKYATIIPVVLITVALFAFRQSDSPLASLEDSTNSAAMDSVPGTVYKVVEEMPRFPGCEDSGLKGDELWNCSLQKMLEHVYQQIKYPQEARKAGVSGRAVAQFVVRSDGRVSDAKILRSLGYGTDEVVLGVIHDMPVWRPGYHEGKAVHVEFTLPVVFKMEQEGTAEKDSSSQDPVVVTTAPEKSPVAEEVYKVVEEMPRFPGCEDSGLEGQELQQCSFGKLVSFIQERMQYPEEAKKAGIEGKSIVQFIVRANGSITDPKIVRSIGGGTDQVVLDIVRAMPNWRPGYQRGKAVDVMMTLPVSFVLPPDNEQNISSAPKAGASLQIEIFPVPSGDKLNYTIALPAGSGEVVIELLSQNGQVVAKDNQSLQFNKAGLYSGSFNIGNVTPGTYVIRAQWAGNAVTKSVVIQ